MSVEKQLQPETTSVPYTSEEFTITTKTKTKFAKND